MHLPFLIVITLGLTAALTQLGKKLDLPYPTLQVLAGTLLGTFPSVGRVRLDPQIAFHLFFPALLFCAGWFTSWPDFKRHLRSITILAIGLVLFTMVAVAAVAHLIVPGLSWPVAFLLGALVSPTDPVAATNIAKRSGVSARVVTILEGESWLNDGTGLVLYRIAIAAVLTGFFSVTHAALQFTSSLCGGVVVGFVTGFVVSRVSRLRLELRVIVSLYVLAAYTSYFLAEQIQASGIVASCVAGIFLAQTKVDTCSTDRARTSSFFETINFLLSSSLFIILGLQLPEVLHSLAPQGTSYLLVGALTVSAVVVLTRLLWIAAGTQLSVHALSKDERKRARHEAAIVGWSGFRGALSVVAALAIPLSGPQGAFPHRDLLIFLSFSVVLATLGLQGLALPHMIRRFHWATDEHSLQQNGASASGPAPVSPSYALENTTEIQTI